MKKATKLWLFILAFTMILSLALTLPALAAETDETNAEATMDTPYGNIPEEYASSPIILFDADTKVAFKSVSAWGNGGALQYMRSDQNGGHTNTVVYLQGDITTTDYANFGNVSGTHVIDLNGHTLTVANTAAFSFIAKDKAADAQFTIKNGTIALNEKKLLEIGSNGGKSSTATYIFENVEFTNVGAKANLVTESTTVTGSSTNTTNVTFKNCTFNLAASPAQALCLLGNNATGRSDKFPVNVTFEGGVINATKASDLDKIFLNGYGVDDAQPYENKTIVFTAGENGYTTGVTALSTTPHLGAVLYPVDNGSEYYFIHESFDVDQTKSIYYLDTYNTEYSEYGAIPQRFINNPEEHNIILFVDGYAVISATDFGAKKNTTNQTHGGAFELSRKYSGKDIVLMLLDDVTETVTYGNVGYMYGNYTVDLNEKTVTLGGALVSLQAKNTNALNMYFKNGTIHVGNSNLVNLASPSNSDNQNKAQAVTFENVTIDIAESSLVLLGSGNKWISESNITFNDCTVNSSAVTTELFKFRASAETSKNSEIKFQGGQINYTANKIPSPCLDENDFINVSFGDNEGNYPIVTAKDTVAVEEIAFPKGEETLYLRKTGSAEGVINYKLSAYGFVSTYLNLSSDLNMIYRVFLPEDLNPTVTFNFNGFETSVKSSGYDSNGLYLFKLPYITPAQMNQNIAATLWVDGEKLDDSSNITIKAYLDTVKAQNGTTDKTEALVDALLVYGAAAQQYVNETTEGFDQATLEKLATLGNVEDNATYEKTGNGIEKFAMNLSGTFQLRVGIVVDDATDVTLTVSDGKETTVYNVKNYAVDNQNIRAIVCDSFTATELDKVFTFTLKRGEEVLDTVSINANEYLRRASAQNEDADLTTLAKALYAYGVAAEDYITVNVNKTMPYLAYSSVK